jgi:MFS transporter, DHA1 family, multidrug resistance protein
MMGLIPAHPPLDRRALGRRLIVASAAIGAWGPSACTCCCRRCRPLRRQFAVRASTAQLLVSLSLLAIAFGNLVVAPLSDRFGRRPVIMAGLVLFMLGSLAGAVAPSMPLLIATRILQAFGAGAAMAVARAAIMDFFGPDRAAGAMATTATAVLVVPMLAPTLGGFTIEWFDWRASFAARAGPRRRRAVVHLDTHCRDPRGRAAAGPAPRTLSSYRQLLANPATSPTSASAAA